LNENQSIINAIHLLSQLNDPQLSLAQFEARFIQGLQTVFDNEFALMVLVGENPELLSIRKSVRWGEQEIIEDNINFTEGLLFTAYEQLKLLQFSPGKIFSPSLAIDAPVGIHVHSFIAMPLVYQTQLFGVLGMGNSPKIPLNDVEMDVFSHLGNELAHHIHSVKMVLDLEESNNYLQVSQQQLLNSRNTLRTLFDNIPESFYVVDENYTLIAVNLSRADRAGTTPRNLVSKKCYDGLYHLNSPCTGCLVGKTLQTKTSEVRRVHYLQKDQTNLEWEIHTYLVPEIAGKPGQVILLEQNITEKRKLEAELIQSEKLAAVGQLTAGIAHDINNPLTSIIANAQILLEDIPEEQTDLIQCARLIELAGTKATQVVRNLLTSARKEEFEFLPIDINESIQNALILLSHEFISRDIKIIFDRGNEMPKISASENHLQSVWTNLIMNAIEAIGSAEGKIDIRSHFDGDNFIVTVQDNGKGIPNEYIGEIFEPFFTTKHSDEGTGLGLTSVRRIVQAHNGRIMVESAEGEGCTFTVVLPKEQVNSVAN
jgi:two-component system NtrC family sensor kinase